MTDMECRLKIFGTNGWLLELQVNALVHIHLNPSIENVLEKKGIGRFAVDKLGDKVSVITKKEGEEKWLKVDIDWTAYYTETEKEADIRLFTDMENVYTYNDAENPDVSGTKLIITSIREPWTKKRN